MNRRQFIAVSSLGIAVPGVLARAGEFEKHAYSRETYESALASGEAFLLDFYASW